MERLGHSQISYRRPGRVSDGLLHVGILMWISSVTPPMLDHSPIIKIELPLAHALVKGAVTVCTKRSANVCANTMITRTAAL